jgi:uncharacterized protein (DUF697 family)
MIACMLRCLGRLTWSQWVMLLLFGVLVAVITFLSGGTLTAAAVAGLGSSLGSQLVVCFGECSR